MTTTQGDQTCSKRGPRALAAAAQPAADAVAAAFGGDGFVTLTASGSVSDFSDDDKSSLQQKVADAAGVDKSLVTILVAAASVRITAHHHCARLHDC
eukprot:scaffold118291_cov56-Phaeocystis_antarctica.AAC.1